MDYRTESPKILRDFLSYHETIRGHSHATVDEYFLDLRMFFRFLKLSRGLAQRSSELDEISIDDIDLGFVSAVTLTEVYEYLAYLSRDRMKNPRSRETGYGLKAASRSRKIAAIRSFYKYLCVKAKLLSENPVQDLDSPKVPHTLPRFLSLEESRQLLSSVDGEHRQRDYCILCIFLNCGLRISEIVGQGQQGADRLPERRRGIGHQRLFACPEEHGRNRPKCPVPIQPAQAHEPRDRPCHGQEHPDQGRLGRG